MKKFLMGSFLISMSLFSQENNDIFIVNKDVISLLTKKKPVKNAYKIKTIKNTISTSKTVKQESKKYNILKKRIDSISILRDSINNINANKLKKYDEVNSIIDNIQFFLQSQKPYQLKKKLLKTAQSTALKYNYQQLIYADQNYNHTQRSRFLVMSLNPIELKIHLRRVVSSIQNKNLQPTLKIFDKSLLDQLKKDFNNTKPTYFIKTSGKSKITRKTFTNGKVIDTSIINGTFKKIEDCYLILYNFKNIFKKNQVVNSKELDQLKINYNQLRYVELDLIENMSSKQRYIVDNQFLKTYGSKK